MKLVLDNLHIFSLSSLFVTKIPRRTLLFASLALMTLANLSAGLVGSLLVERLPFIFVFPGSSSPASRDAVLQQLLFFSSDRAWDYRKRARTQQVDEGGAWDCGGGPWPCRSWTSAPARAHQHRAYDQVELKRFPKECR